MRRRENTLARFGSKMLLMLTLVLFVGFTACTDDDNGTVEPETDPTLLDVIQDDPEFSTLAGIIQDLGLTDAVTNDELTVFAPTNSAFDAISDVIPTLTNEDLTQIVLYHLTEGTVFSTDLGAQQDVEMLQGEVTLIESGVNGVLINGDTEVVKPDLEASNGVVHGIDSVLLPTEYRVALEGPSLVEVAEQAGNFTTLIELAETAGLTTTLQFKGPYTAFAPTDAAFEELGQQVDLGAITSDTNLLALILTYHVLFGEVLSTDLEAQQTVASATQEPLYITAGDDGVTVNGNADVTTADITDATNGVIHVVDSVLLPNPTIPVTGIVSKNYNLTTLLSLVAERPDILNTLADESGEFTIFAPTNEAFEAALAANPGLTDEQITEILTYHVLAAEVLSTDLSDGQTATTLQGEDITVTIDGDTVQINNANVVAADLQGNNGVVHVIDSVILPPSYTEE
jgi:transforming growth factor-beta-induced protein